MIVVRCGSSDYSQLLSSFLLLFLLNGIVRFFGSSLFLIVCCCLYVDGVVDRHSLCCVIVDFFL